MSAAVHDLEHAIAALRLEDLETGRARAAVERLAAAAGDLAARAELPPTAARLAAAIARALPCLFERRVPADAALTLIASAAFTLRRALEPGAAAGATAGLEAARYELETLLPSSLAPPAPAPDVPLAALVRKTSGD